ncbi:unnamed protein product [Microthlaspi erraticum]|uniref:Uncharacterized protein n=1 Tax=Microthlaspi erraticum TaxID=1685480 RepID=A0A6D2KC54_9BRAS|nr:unnamed protein product [Microthlaspi erraticum]
MTRKGRIWSSMLIFRHRTRSSWNKTLNQSSIELKKPRFRKTNQSSIEPRREQTKQAPANQLNLLQGRKILHQDHHHTNDISISFMFLSRYLEMNHNTNIHFGNRTLIPHDLHGRIYQDPAVTSCHIRSLPTIE